MPHHQSRPPLYSEYAIILVLAVLVAPVQALGQDRGSPFGEYLKRQNLEQAHEELQRALEKRTQAGLSNAKRKRLGKEFVRRWSRRCVLNGVTVSNLETLEASGFNILGEVAPDLTDNPARDVVQAHALTHDLVVIGTIESVERTTEPADGFTTTFSVQVQERLKGNPPRSMITVRQKTGRTEKRSRGHFDENGALTAIVQDPERVEGQTYLLFLSSGQYAYKKVTHRVYRQNAFWEEALRAVQRDEREPTYSLGYANQIRNGKIHVPENDTLKPMSASRKQSSHRPNGTKEMLSYIRTVDALLETSE